MRVISLLTLPIVQYIHNMMTSESRKSHQRLQTMPTHETRMQTRMALSKTYARIVYTLQVGITLKWPICHIELITTRYNPIMSHCKCKRQFGQCFWRCHKLCLFFKHGIVWLNILPKLCYQKNKASLEAIALDTNLEERMGTLLKGNKVKHI